MGGQDSHREEEPGQCGAVRKRIEQARSGREERRGRESQQEPAAMVSKSRAEWRGRRKGRTALDGALETRGRAESGCSRASAVVRPKRETLWSAGELVWGRDECTLLLRLFSHCLSVPEHGSHRRKDKQVQPSHRKLQWPSTQRKGLKLTIHSLFLQSNLQ